MRTARYVFGMLFLLFSSIVIGLLEEDDNLHLIACDVGQGDAILISHKSYQVLTDGGPDTKVLDCLGRYMPFWDRKIELIILTHPQLDHYGGLIEVLKRYKTETILVRDFDTSTPGLKALKNAIGGSQARVVRPERGMAIRVGMIYLDIVHPAEAYEAASVNEESIVYILDYKDFEAILTGDIGPEGTEFFLKGSQLKDVEYIKVPHHGSKNGLTLRLLEAVRPEVAVISVGKNNRYGHPHEEVLRMLAVVGAKILRTDQIGDIVVTTDGSSWRLKEK